jgi:NADH-quinone oxidoreductase subunit M
MGDTAAAAGGGLDTLLTWASNPLTQIMFLPLLGCLILCAIPAAKHATIRAVTLITALLSFFCSVLLLTGLPVALRDAGVDMTFFREVLHWKVSNWFPFAQYLRFSPDPAVGMQFAQEFKWMSIRFGEIQSFGVNYSVGVDGLSLPLLLLCTTILVMVVLWAWNRTERIKEFFALTLFMQVGLIGSFVALDYVLLYLFWEWMLIPMFFLIAGWGKDTERASRAAIKFFIYTLAGSVFMLIAFIALQVWSQGSVYDFSIPKLMIYSLTTGVESIPTSVRLLIFLGLLIGFAVKAPMWPFHTWLPDAHSEAPTEMSVILAALMLKSGTYMFLRSLYPTFPDICYNAGPLLAFCGVAGIVYGAGITLLQTDLKRMVAWSSISHMGFIMLGISAMNPNGTMGAMFHMVGHGVIIALLFFLVGWLEERYGTRDMRELATRWPLGQGSAAGALLCLAAFAGMGFPGLAGFPGELFTLQGTYFNNPNWLTVQLPSLGRLLGYWWQILTGPDSFMYTQLWHSPDAPQGMTGARFLQICAVLAVLGILTSAVYMITMLTRTVFSGNRPQPEPNLAPNEALAEPQPQLTALEPALAMSSADSGGDLPEFAPVVTRRPRRIGPAEHDMPWNQRWVLYPLAAAVILLGIFPQPLITICTGWAQILSDAQLRF